MLEYPDKVGEVTLSSLEIPWFGRSIRAVAFARIHLLKETCGIKDLNLDTVDKFPSPVRDLFFQTLLHILIYYALRLESHSLHAEYPPDVSEFILQLALQGRIHCDLAWALPKKYFTSLYSDQAQSKKKYKRLATTAASDYLERHLENLKRADQFTIEDFEAANKDGLFLGAKIFARSDVIEYPIALMPLRRWDSFEISRSSSVSWDSSDSIDTPDEDSTSEEEEPFHSTLLVSFDESEIEGLELEDDSVQDISGDFVLSLEEVFDGLQDDTRERHFEGGIIQNLNKKNNNKQNLDLSRGRWGWNR
ncbi:hypothetical protein QAD02_005754 [Eretmocerus hayati]|uniref:Uncharacterized protein n=1 Tax=Eretmocerus hayati TaxID=131215 RepID=A0ACC2NTU4_9HYME|nr:hypothetical protein QAD02_005754 [Eretmocerus hayati]